jgi:hypothetical protein
VSLATASVTAAPLRGSAGHHGVDHRGRRRDGRLPYPRGEFRTSATPRGAGPHQVVAAVRRQRLLQHPWARCLPSRRDSSPAPAPTPTARRSRRGWRASGRRGRQPVHEIGGQRAAVPAARARSGSAAHSAFQARPSRSCPLTMPSTRTPQEARAIRASVSRCSLASGFRLCGIVMLPTAASDGASDSSPISGAVARRPRCRSGPASPSPGSAHSRTPRRGRASLSRDHGIAQARRAQNNRRSSTPSGSKKPRTPTAPASWPTDQRARPRRAGRCAGRSRRPTSRP